MLVGLRNRSSGRFCSSDLSRLPTTGKVSRSKGVMGELGDGSDRVEVSWSSCGGVVMRGVRGGVGVGIRKVGKDFMRRGSVFREYMS